MRPEHGRLRTKPRAVVESAGVHTCTTSLLKGDALPVPSAARGGTFRRRGNARAMGLCVSEGVSCLTYESGKPAVSKGRAKAAEVLTKENSPLSRRTLHLGGQVVVEPTLFGFLADA
jgi:hypothetical protein